MPPSLQRMESHAWLVRAKENQLPRETSSPFELECLLRGVGMAAETAEQLGHSLGAHHTLSCLEGLISLCLCSEGSFPSKSWENSWPTLQTLGSASKGLIPEGFPGSPSKHRPKGRALQH